jgi:hypothetical protein
MHDPLDNINSHWVYEIISGVPQGRRYASAIRLAGRWYAKGLSTIEILSFLVWWNQLNTPPMSDTEVAAIIKSTKKWEDTRYTHPLSDKLVNETIGLVRKHIQDDVKLKDKKFKGGENG